MGTENNTTGQPKPKARDGRRRNPLKHGLRAAELGTVPRGASYIGRLVKQLRTKLEEKVEETKGEVSLQDSLAINTALRWEKHALLCNRWLAKESENMTHEQRLHYSREIARAAESRDKAVSRLNLTTDPVNLLASLYAPWTSPSLEGIETYEESPADDA